MCFSVLFSLSLGSIRRWNSPGWELLCSVTVIYFASSEACFSEIPVRSSPQLTARTHKANLHRRTYTHACTCQNSGFKPPSRELISMHNNDVCVNTILQMSVCEGDKKRQSPVAFSGVASPLFTPRHLFHYQPHRPIIRPDREQAVNQRFTLLASISQSWWILVATYLALRWWTAGSCLLKLHRRPSVSHCTQTASGVNNHREEIFAFRRPDGDLGGWRWGGWPSKQQEFRGDSERWID